MTKEEKEDMLRAIRYQRDKLYYEFLEAQRAFDEITLKYTQLKEDNVQN